MMAALGAVVQHYVKFPGLRLRAHWPGRVHHRSRQLRLRGALRRGGYLGARCLDREPRQGASEISLRGILPIAQKNKHNKAQRKQEPGNFGDPVGFNQYNQDAPRCKASHSMSQIPLIFS